MYVNPLAVAGASESARLAAMGTGATPLEFQAVHDRYRPQVLRYLARLVGEGEAEDLTQSVMLKVSGALPDFRGEASLSTWIHRIAFNTAMDRLRRNATQPPIDPDAEAEDAEHAVALQAATLEDSVVRAEMSACVREFIERLPDTYRAVMVLSELEGFTNEEIAELLGVTLGTVKIRLHRGREKLRHELEAGCSFERDQAGELACDRKPGAAVPITFRRRP